MVGKEPRPFGCRALRACNRRRIGHRLEFPEPFLTGGRDGQARHDGDDAIELEGPESACVHWRNQKRERRPSSLANRHRPAGNGPATTGRRRKVDAYQSTPGAAGATRRELPCVEWPSPSVESAVDKVQVGNLRNRRP